MAVGWEGCSGPQLAFLISRWGGETHFPVGGGPGWHGWCDTGVPCRPLSPPPPPPPPLQCFSCPRAVPMQRFVCSLLPRPGEGEVEAAALSVFGRLRNSFWLPVTGPAAPVDSGNVIQLAVVPARPGGARGIRPMGVWWSLNNMGKLRHGASVPGTLYLQPGGRQEAAPTSVTFWVPQFPSRVHGGAGGSVRCLGVFLVPAGQWGGGEHSRQQGQLNSQLFLPLA